MDFTKLREEYAQLRTEAEGVLNSAEKDGKLSPEDTAANVTRFARMTEIEGVLEQANQFAKLSFEDNAPVVQKADPAPRSDIRITDRNVDQKFDRNEFARSLGENIVSGKPFPQKFATITTTTQSGILLPHVVTGPLIPSAPNTFREAFSVVGMPISTTDTTATYKVPIMSVTDGAAVTETANSETEAAESLAGSIVSTVGTYQSKSTWYSDLELQAVAFDLLNTTVAAKFYAKELGLEAAITAAIVADSAITQTVTTSTTAGFTYGNFVSLNNKLAKRYDRNKVIMLSATAYSAAESMVGTDGQPVLNRDPQNQRLMRFNGTPVLRNDYLEAFGASKVVGVIISLMGFHFRDAGQAELAVYKNIPARPAQTGLNLFGFHAYGYDVSAISTLKTPTS